MSSKFENLLEDYYTQYLQYNPLYATFQGLDGYNDKFVNYLDSEVENEIKELYTNYLTELHQINKSELNTQEQLSYDVLEWELQMGLDATKYPFDQTPIDQMWSLNLNVGQLASGQSAQPFHTMKDYEDWLIRMDGYLEWCESAISQMKKGIESGYVLPKSLVVKVIPQFESLTKGPVENHLFYSPALKIPDQISTEEKQVIEEKYKNLVQNKVIPTYARIATFLQEDYLPHARETSGVDVYEFGADLYQHKIKQYTTTNMTADEIHQLGLAEVARIRSEMEKIKTQIGFEGDIKEFFDFVRNNAELKPFTDPDQVIDNFNRIHKKMLPQLTKLFDMTPKTPFEVRRTEAFREASASAEYNPGSLDGTRPGVFYVPIPDVKNYNVYSDEDLFLHEAIPGHHYQISLQQEDTSLPDFRKSLWYSAYGEGWALYCESLGKELGLYEDPYQYFGMLGAEMHRAIRLVVDTGIHAKGWSRERAIQYSLDNEAESEASIISEIERYMANPGQALSYKIGQLKLIELRQKAEQELGNGFDIREFHNLVLSTGCVPLQLLENQVNAWIVNQNG